MRQFIVVLVFASLDGRVVRLDTARRDVEQSGHLQRRRRAESADTVRLAIATLPVATPGFGLDRGRARAHPQLPSVLGAGHTRQRSTAASPVQLLFFDHNIPLGTPDAESETPYDACCRPPTTSVTVQYQWQVAGDSACCPTGKGTVQYQIGARRETRHPWSSAESVASVRGAGLGRFSGCSISA